jgi:ADP-ribose pyrophosphatase YjhB (NUDIX family)
MSRLDDWRYCPRCSSRLDVTGGRARCPACGLAHYAHSDPTACALCLDDEGRLLLVRRAQDPDRGKWDLPGGFLEEAEHPLDALRRELLEETGLEIEPRDFVGVWIDRYGDAEDAAPTLNMYWTARVVGGEPRPADDAAELRWFRPEELPPDAEIAFRNVVQAIRAWRGRAASE